MREREPARGPVRPRRDRGAGVVEYALGAGLVVVVLLGGVRWVQSAGEEALDRQAANIDYRSDGGGAPSPASTSSTSSTSTTTTAAPSAPTTEAPATTTTTAAPTTTTVPSATAMTALTAVANPTVSWWNGKEGAWLDNVTFTYGWKNGATITVQVTRNYGNNKAATTTETVHIGPGSSTPYLQPNVLANAQSSDVVSVDLMVISIRTQDDAWQDQTFTVSAPTLHIDAPKKP